MKQVKAITTLVIILLVIPAFKSCRNGSAGEEQRELSMVYTEWTESVAITFLSSVLLEEQLEYRVDLKLTDIATAYRDVAEGKADVFADAWLPETHKHYIDQYRDRIETLGIIYPEARIGFVVPAYSNLETVTDLKNYPHDLIGIEEDAGITKKAKTAIERYALRSHLQNLSEEEMTHHLEDSIKRRKEVVVTGWEPHWIFARYEVRFLEDPDNLFGEKEKICAVGRKDLELEHPHAVRFFERLQITEKQLNRLVYFVRLHEDPREGVKSWIKENEYIVNQWVKNLKPERKKIM